MVSVIRYHLQARIGINDSVQFGGVTEIIDHSTELLILSPDPAAI